MSSAHQEPHLLPPPKPKLSPMELRNTDLVSRLLAATPPYLYNMSLLPNTYFFSEMLRSFVQAKNEQQQRSTIGNGYGAGNMFYGHQQTRRSRKRAWNNASRETYLQPHNAVPIAEEKLEKPLEKPDHHEPWMLKSTRKSPENAALELTMTASHSNNTHQQQKSEPPKLEEPSQSFLPLPQESTSNLVLPPPPPMWYPPIYPTPPYGIDPLHFFIDLRVSGHIYDRQNKEAAPQENCTIVSPKEDKKEPKIEENLTSNIFNQKRHCSAFSVPNNNPRSTKFDVKSMGFDKSSNKTSTNYVLSNITSIYKNLSSTTQDTAVNMDVDDKKSETESEKQKRVKDLRALIGLELVVDYMSHKKGLVRSEESSLVSEEASYSEIESCESPHLEVVALHDEVVG
ncbi:unnamed protein product [Ceutorhynchus assimilis]|uniref:Uncharacterized protein n=1 Tax=Ceutorhynchus assimilis TaxID=467358 RepID=A0A9P0GK12_9CUCU|nr:unnamed protein product [Ceutorhynchus assimilis]